VNDELLVALQRVVSKHANIGLTIVFGSVASDTTQRDSDLDIAVDAGKPLSVQERMALTGDLAEASGRPVDLVDLCSVGEPLLGQILAHGRRIAGSVDDYATLLSRHLIDSADFLPYRNRILAERRRAWIGK